MKQEALLTKVSEVREKIYKRSISIPNFRNDLRSLGAIWSKQRVFNWCFPRWHQPEGTNGIPFIVIKLRWWLRQWRICLQYKTPGFDSWVGKIPWRRKCLPMPVFLPGECHGQRSLEGYHPWSGKDSDTTGTNTHTSSNHLWFASFCPYLLMKESNLPQDLAQLFPEVSNCHNMWAHRGCYLLPSAVYHVASLLLSPSH